MRVFQAGPLDASKTVFCQQSPILTCSRGGALEFGIQPRDKYNNKCDIEDIDGKLEIYFIYMHMRLIFRRGFSSGKTSDTSK